MNKQKIRTAIVLVVFQAIIFNGFSFNCAAQQPIVISFGQPNIWSLEQAHYLLARMHRTNLDLKTAVLGDLDPNETNSRRISIIKTLLDAGFKYDEAVGINNKLLKSDKNFNSERRQELLTQRSSLQADSRQLSGEIAELKIAKTKTSENDEKARLDAEIEAKTEQKAAVKEETDQITDELKGLSSATGNFEAVGTDLNGFDKTKLPDSALDALVKEKTKDLTINPTIAASQRLENHVQMQYEIIAKQLTLLRDEVGPGERLVFLELPQSINASQNKADNKMAQVWWRVGGYTKIDRNKVFTNELNNLLLQINTLKVSLNNYQNSQSNDQKTASDLKNQLDLKTQLARLEVVFADLCNQKTEKEKLAKDLEAKKNIEDCEQKLAKTRIEIKNLDYSIKEAENALKETEQAVHASDDQAVKIQRETAKFSQSLTSLYTKYEKLKLQAVKNEIQSQQDTADRLLQGGGEKIGDVIDSTMKLLGGKTDQFFLPSNRIIENSTAERSFVSFNPENASARLNSASILKNNAVRTIDIIPRQNAVNVNTTKETVKATGIVAAFSFLFGFGGKINYQKQSENFEQALNQELYTSGFGKGNTDFGWNFYPFAGTKQIAPGVRTTYAVAVVPDDAETIVLKAKGCYFPRKEYQPLDYDSIDSWRTNKNVKNADCTAQEQTFIVPVPGASGRESDFYATDIRYNRNQTTDRRMVASIYGQNFSPQTGVLVDGIPLSEAVGLAQTAVESTVAEKVAKSCDRGICGRFERISSTQIVISFDVQSGYRGTPNITLVAPGKAIELNNLYLKVNGREDVKLSESDYMFGSPPVSPAISIDNFQAVSRAKAILTGEGFDKVAAFYVNGETAVCENSVVGKKSLCVLNYTASADDVITVTLAPTEDSKPVISETFPNPFNLRITDASIINFEAASKAPILTVKLEGSGFHDNLSVDLDAASKKRGASIVSKISPSSGQMILEIVSPGPILQIILRDPQTNNSVTTILRVPPL